MNFALLSIDELALRVCIPWVGHHPSRILLVKLLEALHHQAIAGQDEQNVHQYISIA